MSAYQDLQTLEHKTKGILPLLMIIEMTNKFLNIMKTRDKIIFGLYPEPVMKTKFSRTCQFSMVPITLKSGHQPCSSGGL